MSHTTASSADVGTPEGAGLVGRVILAATPLGQPADASQRLIRAISETPVIAAEDTRRFRRLASELAVTVTGQVVSFFEGNEQSRLPQLLAHLQAGRDVLVVTDAGMPAVSDPGYRLVTAAIHAGVQITSLPGPSAVTTALAMSGLPVDRFCFEGFLPRKPGARVSAIQALSAERRTMVLFEAPHRLAVTLADLSRTFGADRPAAVCRELTKTYEEVRRGTLGELTEWAAVGVRGEITLVVGGASAVPVGTGAQELSELVGLREAAGVSRKDAIAEVARDAGVAKRLVYEAVIAGKQAAGDNPPRAAGEPAAGGRK